MNFYQTLFLLAFAVLNAAFFYKAFLETKHKKNAFGLTRHFFFIGAFVWADVIVFSPFWILACIAALLLKSWTLFLLILSVFWLVRSIGETIYWFNQQFSPINRNPVENLPLRSVFHNDSIWFVHQIFWQCVTVTTIITTIYFSFVWIQQLAAFGM